MENEMNSIPKLNFVESVAYLLRETFEGSPEGQPSAFLDRGVGVFNTLNEINAEGASMKIGGTSIAALTEHAKFYLDRLSEFMAGRSERVNWEDSWLIETVNTEEWDALRSKVRESYENALRSYASTEDWTERHVGEAIAMVAHTAYHLGAIRQLAKMARKNN